ncbi:MAG: SDR family oxidoreductase [Rhizobiales bacterium]|nr:SDR family oxidoreductase [Hyphomicrobiales bacterium]
MTALLAVRGWRNGSRQCGGRPSPVAALTACADAGETARLFSCGACCTSVWRAARNAEARRSGFVKQADLFDINGHVALVTGAASGPGLAFAEVMAENGAKTILTDIDAAGLDRETSRLRAAGCDVERVVVDILDTAALRAAIDGAVERHGRLDAVFANAGISSGPGYGLSPDGAIDALDLALFERAIQINLHAAFHTIRLAAIHMKRQKSGSIVVTSSIGGTRSEPFVGYGYAGSKAAINNIVRHAAADLAPSNVRVNAIAPGAFLTNIAGGRLKSEPERAKKFAAMSPMNRIAMPDEIKGLALLLASPAGSFITGAVIPIDGGTTAR